MSLGGHFLVLREQLLRVMDQKDHQSWQRIAAGNLTLEQLRVHYQQEWEVYVRDFPCFLARVLALGPPPDVQRRLAENLYEEATGRLSQSRPHPQMFLEMMGALGLARKDFLAVTLTPQAARYRAWLDSITRRGPWTVAAAVVTVFVEGSINDRREIANAQAPSAIEIERMVRQHVLVRHYGVDPSQLSLIRAHRLVEGGHRHDAYSMVIDHVQSRAQTRPIVQAVATSLTRWLAYRDEVLNTMNGIKARTLVATDRRRQSLQRHR